MQPALERTRRAPTHQPTTRRGRPNGPSCGRSCRNVEPLSAMRLRMPTSSQRASQLHQPASHTSQPTAPASQPVNIANKLSSTSIATHRTRSQMKASTTISIHTPQPAELASHAPMLTTCLSTHTHTHTHTCCQGIAQPSFQNKPSPTFPQPRRVLSLD